MLYVVWDAVRGGSHGVYSNPPATSDLLTGRKLPHRRREDEDKVFFETKPSRSLSLSPPPSTFIYHPYYCPTHDAVDSSCQRTCLLIEGRLLLFRCWTCVAESCTDRRVSYYLSDMMSGFLQYNNKVLGASSPRLIGTAPKAMRNVGERLPLAHGKRNCRGNTLLISTKLRRGNTAL